MRKAILKMALLSCIGLLGCSNRESSKPSTKPVETESAAPDNTKVNERDRGGATVTPTDQSNTDRDLKLTQDLRKQLVDDDSLSFDAKNVKIVSTGGVVTLRGPVHSEAEKQLIESRARALPGVASVDNELEVKTGQ
jgi:hyperosmotically inducible periplasmic protein